MRLMQAEDPEARDRMAWASLCGGIALANGGLGAVHGLAGVIGGLTGAAHGAICGALLGPVLDMNRRLTGGMPRLARLRADLAPALACPPDTVPVALADWARAQGLPGLAALGLDPARHQAVAEAALTSSSMRGNPVTPGIGDLVAALSAAS